MRLYLGFALFLASTWAGASIMIDRAVVEFSPGRPLRQDVIVTNPDPEPAFLDVEVLEVRDPGTPEETRQVVRNPEALGLIASPRRLMVPPGAQRVVRLVSLKGHQEREQVYRVNIRPAAGRVESDTMAVKVLVAYQLLVFVPPARPEVGLAARRTGKVLHLSNTGNVNISLHHGRQCPEGAASEEVCEETPGQRLYPGNTLEIGLPRDAPVEYAITAAGATTERHFE